MYFRLKAVSVAALGISLIAASMAGVSMADETLPTLPAFEKPVSSSLSPSDSDARDTRPSGGIVFAAPKEVVQPLPLDETQDATDPAGPMESRPVSLASLVRATDVGQPLDTQTHCLATAIFYEARSESLEGQLAVARVIVNRAASQRFANSLCNVIRQPGQFSFVRRGVIPAPKVKRPAWKTAVAIALIAQDDAWESEAEGALFFHARRVSPGWRRARIAMIDNHIFYR